MSTFNNPPAVDGEALRATTLNTKAGTLLETPINALDKSSIERHALDAQHLPDLSFDSVFSSGYSATAPNNIQANDAWVYDNGLPLSAANTAYPYTYQTFDATTPATPGTAIPYYGATTTLAGLAGGYAPAGSHVFAGWRIPSFNQALQNIARVALDSATSFDAVGISGVICRGGVEPLYAGDPVSGSGSTPTFLYAGQATVAVGIGWEDGAGNKHVVERSVRFYSVNACKHGNAAAFTYLKQSDLDAGDGTCKYIFLVVACVRPGHIDSAKTGTVNRDVDWYDHLLIRYYDFCVTPVRAGSLS